MKSCPFCGEQIQDSAIKCRWCGEFLEKAPQPGPLPAVSTHSTSGLAIGSMVTGIIGLLFFPLLIIALILGFAALIQIKKGGGTIGGKGMAITGTVLGLLGILAMAAIIAAIALPGLLKDTNLINQRAVVRTLREIQNAQELHYLDNNKYAGNIKTLVEDGYLEWEMAGGELHGYFFQIKLTEETGHSWHATARPVSPEGGRQRYFRISEYGEVYYSHDGPAEEADTPVDFMDEPYSAEPPYPYRPERSEPVQKPQETEEPDMPAEVPEPEPEPVKPPITRMISMEVTAETWDGDTPGFDVGKALQERLEDLGVGVRENEKENIDGILRIDYEEEKGQGYAISPFSEPTAWGTNITCTLTLVKPETTEALLEYEIYSSPPSYVSGIRSLYQHSLDAFREEAGYKFAPEMIASALRVESAYAKCLPALLQRGISENVLNLLENLKFEPRDDREKALFAIAREDFEKCIPLGEKALEPLQDYMSRYYWYYDYEVSESVREIPAILAKIGDEKAARFLRSMLRRFEDEFVPENLYDSMESGIALIEAVAIVGSEDDIKILDGISKSLEGHLEENEYYEDEFEELIEAVDKAKTTITERLGEK